MRKKITPKNRAEWLQARNNGIGSSEVATVLGLNPFETPYRLWRRKKGIDQTQEETFAMRAGHYLEDAVSKFYADETGATIIKSSAGDWFYTNDLRPYLQVSPDRTGWPQGSPHNEAGKIILECKTTQRQVDPQDVPDHWYLQLQYQLGTAEMNHGALAWLTQGRDFGYKEFDFDQQIFDFMISRIDEFWDRYILGDEIPPDINDADTLLRYPLHTMGKRFTADITLADKVAELKEVKKEISALDQRKEEIECEIKMAFGDCETMYDAYGNILATWKAPKPAQKLDGKALQNEQPEIYNKYCTQCQGARRFIIK